MNEKHFCPACGELLNEVIGYRAGIPAEALLMCLNPVCKSPAAKDGSFAATPALAMEDLVKRVRSEARARK